ncbi:hypothetical protein P692DRAFT_20825793 [Suillus brevipes Sb2]|nr:hypothetical protein P692DRAFT_20825793 [Suillus brevipes Sb2]
MRILRNIFKFLEEDERLDGYDNKDIPACLAVTHVCRHWRNVALECPTLWRFISSSSPFWLDIMLERSKETPLIVTYAIPMPLEDCLEKVLLHLPRIKYLEFRAWSCDVGHIMDLELEMVRSFQWDPYQAPSSKDKHPYSGMSSSTIVTAAGHRAFLVGFALYAWQGRACRISFQLCDIYLPWSCLRLIQ